MRVIERRVGRLEATIVGSTASREDALRELAAALDEPVEVLARFSNANFETLDRHVLLKLVRELQAALDAFEVHDIDGWLKVQGLAWLRVAHFEGGADDSYEFLLGNVRHHECVPASRGGRCGTRCVPAWGHRMFPEAKVS